MSLLLYPPLLIKRALTLPTLVPARIHFWKILQIKFILICLHNQLILLLALYILSQVL